MYLDDFALVTVVLDDGGSLLLEGLETLDDGRLVVVGSATCLASLQKTLLHYLLVHLEIEHGVAGCHLTGKR